MQRLVLFDIDGTILSAGKVAALAFREALREVFGTPGPANGVSFAGKTDPEIARELLEAAGVPHAQAESSFPRLWERYLERLGRDLQEDTVHVHPGVLPLLGRVEDAADALVPGLLTGNLLEGAHLKLRAARIDPRRFLVGAYGSDHPERRELPELAVRRARTITGRSFTRKEIVIIGDTPADIACGAHLEVRTIAVATGTYGMDALADCGPDYLFADLSDVAAVWEAIVRD
jgi:phosphoglycolate phosphatase